MWLLKAFFLLIFPVPVSLKRFLAPDFVFNFGIVLLFIILLSISVLATPRYFRNNSVQNYKKKMRREKKFSRVEEGREDD
jgi:hypothetical protein